jgi:hypothetical protein
MSLLTTNDVAALLSVTPKQVRKLIRARAMNAENITPGGGRKTWRVDPDELRAFRERQQMIPRETVRRRRAMADESRVIQFIK